MGGQILGYNNDVGQLIGQTTISPVTADKTNDAEILLDQLSLLGKKINISLVYELTGIVLDDELFDLLDLALSPDTINTVIRALKLMRSRMDPMQLVFQLENIIMDVLVGKCDYKARSRFSSPSRMFSLANASPFQSRDMVMNREFGYQNEMNPSSSISGRNESMIHGMIQQEPMVQSDDFGSNGRLGSNFSPQMKMVRLADITGSSKASNAPQMLDMDTIHNLSSQTAPTNVNPTALKAQFFNNSSQSDSNNLSGSETHTKPQSSFSHASDLNRMIEATNSWSSNIETGPQLQPNLALQL
ncbi:unnamed protein product [Vicia faba]|uniref:Uncharacterized protein n=1 Tax=Vicia faba TaxID=3906 RepID=A0AAV0Z3H2_VICFA|nr:unnamed protein product [Vicia faba]